METVYYLILVPMVYLAAAVFVIGIIARIIAIARTPREATAQQIFPAHRGGGLLALYDTFLMPQARRHAPVFWGFLIAFHVAFLLLILAHLDLIPGITIMSPESPNMLGYGFVGVVLILAVFYFLLRRFVGPVKDISVLGDYLLLLLLLFIVLSGDIISWGNSWSESGFVMTKQDFRAYLGSMVRFQFANPRDFLYGSHYIILVLHVLLANLFLMIFPFTKIMHTFFALPMNRLRRG